jgi:chromosome partitioning protein
MKMKTIAVLSQKGGSGKTTIALHLAVASALSGKNTAIIDLDPQASAARWGDRRETELPVVISAQAARLGKEIDRVRDLGGEFLIIDTAPHSDSAALEAARAADLVIIPCRPAILDLEAITSTTGLVEVTKTPAFVVMNAVAPVGAEAESALDLLKSLDIAVCPTRLGNRVAFSRALVSGQTAQEVEPEGKAAMEVTSLHMFVCEHVH